MSDLVNRLSTGRHPVSVARYKSADELERAVAQGFVLVKFTETRGGTELGFKIDKAKSNVDSRSPSGKLQLVGPLTLDYVRVECDVELDVDALAGTGALRPVDDATGAMAQTSQTQSPTQPAKPKKSSREREQASGSNGSGGDSPSAMKASRTATGKARKVKE